MVTFTNSIIAHMTQIHNKTRPEFILLIIDNLGPQNVYIVCRCHFATDQCAYVIGCTAFPAMNEKHLMTHRYPSWRKLSWVPYSFTTFPSIVPLSAVHRSPCGIKFPTTAVQITFHSQPLHVPVIGRVMGTAEHRISAAKEKMAACLGFYHNETWTKWLIFYTRLC